MGVIQSGINQLIGTAAMTARLLPGYEIAEAKKAWTKADKAITTATTAFGNIEGTKPGERQMAFTSAEDAELFKESGLIQQHLEHVQEGAKLGIIDPKDYKESLRSIRGLQRADQRAQQQLEQQQRFNNFRDMFTEGGRYR